MKSVACASQCEMRCLAVIEWIADIRRLRQALDFRQKKRRPP